MRVLTPLMRGPLAVLMLLACQDPTAPTLDPLSGDFPLIAYNGDGLPVNEFELSNRQGGGTGCWSVLTSGTLALSRKPDDSAWKPFPETPVRTRWSAHTTSLVPM